MIYNASVSSDHSSEEDDQDTDQSAKFFPSAKMDKRWTFDPVFSKHNAQSNTQSKKVASENFGGAENRTSSLLTSRKSQSAIGRNTGFCDYETLCKSNLARGDRPETDFSPLNAYVDNKWGSSVKNWSLWTFWKPELLDFTLPTNRKTGQMKCYLEDDLVSVVNLAFSKDDIYEQKGWEPLVNDSFLAIRVTQADMASGKRPFTEEICFHAHQLAIRNEDEQSGFKKKPINLKLLARAGLAEIIQTTVHQSDVLIISGGYSLEPLLGQTSTIVLNQNKKHHTQILRVPGYMFDQNSLCEKIEPAMGEKRFKFTYIARRGATRRIVEQHRYFSDKNFCRKVTDTFVCSRNKWDFPMPVMKKTVTRVYELLCSPDFTMFYSATPLSISDSESTEMHLGEPYRYLGRQRNKKVFSKPSIRTGIPGPDKNNNRTRFSPGCICNLVLSFIIIALLIFFTVFVDKMQVCKEDWQNPLKSYFDFYKKS